MLATYLVGNYRAAGRASVGSDDNTAIIQSTNDGGTCGCGLWERDAFGVESEVAVVVGEVEARHVAGVRSTRGDRKCIKMGQVKLQVEDRIRQW